MSTDPKNNFMKSSGLTILFILFAGVIIFGSSCAPKYGCPGGKNVGAERLLSGEKLPKQKKFRA
jgi:hypothetical protein